MKTSKMSRLLALSDREYTKNRAAPARQKFKAVHINLMNLGNDWERRRGAAVRMMGVILRHDSESLLQKMTADPASGDAFGEAVDWLRKEATILRRTADRLDVASARLSSVVSRYQQREAPLPGAEASDAGRITT